MILHFLTHPNTYADVPECQQHQANAG